MNLCASETSTDSCGTENVWMMIKAMCNKNDLNEGLDTKRPRYKELGELEVEKGYTKSERKLNYALEF